MSDHASKLLEHQLSMLTKLTEAVSLDASSWGYTDPRDLGIGDTPPFIPPIPNSAHAFLNRLKRGEYLPAFLTEPQLAWMRRRIRMTVINNEIAINAVNQRINYSVGNGMNYEVQKRYDAVPDAVVSAAQLWVDNFVEANNLAQREAELVSRMDIDGEALMRVFPRAGGLLHVRFVEPEHCFSPNGDRVSSSFGVETDPYDVEDVKGYWIINGIPDEGAPVELVPACDVLHVKHPETPLNSKRGLSSFFSIEPTLRAAEDLLTSTVFLAKTRAKIAWIQKLSGTTSSLAQQLANNQASYTATDPTTSEQLNIERIRYGSILRIPNTSEIEMPSANIAASDHVAVMQMVLRIIAARFSMPEYMLTADASNGNYASTLVAESPFVKAMGRLQSHIGKHLGGNRFGTHTRSLVWRQLRHAADCGMLPSNIEQLVNVHVVGTSLNVRDSVKEASVDKIYHELGVKSLRTICNEQELNFDSEQKNLKAEKEMGIKEQPPPPPPPPPTLPTPGSPLPPVKEEFNKDQPRADDGKFGSGGGSAKHSDKAEKVSKLRADSDASETLGKDASGWMMSTPPEGDWDALDDHTAKAEGIVAEAERLAASAPKAGKALSKHADKIKKLTSSYREKLAKAKDAKTHADSLNPGASPPPPPPLPQPEKRVNTLPEPVRREVQEPSEEDIPNETPEMESLKAQMETAEGEVYDTLSDAYDKLEASHEKVKEKAYAAYEKAYAAYEKEDAAAEKEYDKAVKEYESEDEEIEKEYDKAYSKWAKDDEKQDKEHERAVAKWEKDEERWEAAKDKAEAAWEKADDTNTTLGESLDALSDFFDAAALEIHLQADDLDTPDEVDEPEEDEPEPDEVDEPEEDDPVEDEPEPDEDEDEDEDN